MSSIDFEAIIKEHIKKREWKKAIELFKENEIEVNLISADLYVYYGYCLRMDGESLKSEKVLKEAYDLFPKNEKILREMYNLYNQMGAWKKAIDVASALIEIDPENENYYERKGSAYSWSGDKENARKMFELSLAYTHNLPFEEIINKIKEDFTDEPHKIKSEYKLPGGMNNLGMIIHDLEGRQYITKITKASTKASKDEKELYIDLLKEFPEFQKMIPLLISINILDNIQYMTIEFIETKTSKKLSAIIHGSQEISSVPYKDIINKFPNENYTYFLKKRPNFIAPFFTQIHTEYYNKKLLDDLIQLAIQHNYKQVDIDILKHVKKLILNNALYQHINPTEHYSLLHGDFKPANVGKDQDGNLKVFDWANYKVGPHFLDLARYFQATSTSYSNIKKYYLFNDNIKRSLSEIEKIFFLYLFILFHFIVITKQNRDNKVIRIITPALADLETLIQNFEGQEVKPSEFVGGLLTHNYKYLLKEEQKLRNTRRKFLKIKKENNTLKKQIYNIEKSKSWRMTAPIRKMFEVLNQRK